MFCIGYSPRLKLDIFCVILICFANLSATETIKNDQVLNIIEDLHRFNDPFNNIFNSILHQNIEIVSNGSNSSTQNLRADENGYDDVICGLQFAHFLEALNSSEFWALNVFDSWGKIPSGILVGNTYSLGSFDQCLKVEEITNIPLIDTIRGQYCLVPLNLILGITLNIGVCIPDTCSPQFFLTIIDSLLPTTRLAPGEISENINTMCYKNQELQLEVIDWIAISFFGLVLFLMLASSCYDIHCRRRKQIPHSGAIAFSIITNAKRLFSCHKTASPDVLECVHGIRVLSIIWIVYGHSYLTVAAAPFVNAGDIVDWVAKFTSMLPLAGTIAVDSFFLISGLLVTWAVFKELDKKRKLNVPLMYLHRYWRLTPTLAATILLTVSLLRYIGSGPMWNTMMEVNNGCRNYWWSSLLYVQNYVNPTEICIGHTWYLSVDMQLFILSPLLLYPLWRWGRKVLWTIPVLICLSMGCVFAIFFIYEYSIQFLRNAENESHRMRSTYYATHIRIGAWLVGVALGYILHHFKGKQIHIPKFIVILGWLISLGTILAIIFGLYPSQQISTPPTVLESTFYESFSRVSWAIALAWIVFACVHGYGGFINKFLSMSFWLPLSRLSYCIYIYHLIIQLILAASVRTTSFFSDINTIHKFWGDFGITLTVSVVWTLAFESPMLLLEKMIFKRDSNANGRQQEISGEQQDTSETNLVGSSITIEENDKR